MNDDDLIAVGDVPTTKDEKSDDDVVFVAKTRASWTPLPSPATFPNFGQGVPFFNNFANQPALAIPFANFTNSTGSLNSNTNNNFNWNPYSDPNVFFPNSMPPLNMNMWPNSTAAATAMPQNNYANYQNSDYYSSLTTPDIYISDDDDTDEDVTFVEEKATQPSKLLRNSNHRTCSFCASNVSPGAGILLRNCFHPLCLYCARGAVEYSTQLQIQCPQTNCDKFMLIEEIRELVSRTEFDKYLNRSLPPNKTNDKKSENSEPKVPEKSENSAEKEKDWKEKWSLVISSLGMEKPGSSSATVTQLTPDKDTLFALSLHLEESPLFMSKAKFECPICFCDVEPEEGVILKGCFHHFCTSCLTAVITHSEEAVVPCPHIIGNATCSSPISDREIRALVSPEFYESFLNRSVTQAELTIKNSFHCKTVNCEGWWEMDRNVTDLTHQCAVCQKNNCLKCKAVHEAVSCAEYQLKLQTDQLDIQTKSWIQKNVNNGLVMKCPTCKILVEKNGGCPHMYCTICKTHFQWFPQQLPSTQTGQNAAAATVGNQGEEGDFFVPVASMMNDGNTLRGGVAYEILARRRQQQEARIALMEQRRAQKAAAQEAKRRAKQAAADQKRREKEAIAEQKRQAKEAATAQRRQAKEAATEAKRKSKETESAKKRKEAEERRRKARGAQVAAKRNMSNVIKTEKMEGEPSEASVEV